MNRIDSYHFGQIVIDGEKYSSDVIIFPGRIQSAWYSKKGHELSLEDITWVITENPEVLLVGTGASGLVKVLPEVQQAAEARDIQLIVLPTGEACEIYNRLSPSQKVVAVLHLTC